MRKRALSYERGFVGPPIARDMTGSGAPEMVNLCLTPEGGALRPLPGFRRSYGMSLGDATGLPVDGSFGVVKIPSEGINSSLGVGIGLVYPSTKRLHALTVYQGGLLPDLVDPGDGAAETIGTLRRAGIHDYPMFAHAGNLLLCGTEHDEVHCYDGASWRKAGVRAPALAPVVETEVAEDEEDLPIQEYFLDGTETWVSMKGELLTIDTLTDVPSGSGDGEDSYAQFSIGRDIRHDRGILAYTAKSGVLGSTGTGISFYIRSEANFDTDKTLDLNIIFDATATMTGSAEQRVTIPATISLTKRWVKINVDALTLTDFAFESIGFQVASGIDNDLYMERDGTLGDWFWIALDGLCVYRGEGTGDEALEPDTYQICFAWWNPNTLRESAPSPYSTPIEFAEATLNIDIAGISAGLPAGLGNSPPTGFPAVRIYIHRRSWGSDPLTGFPVFHRLIEDGIPDADADGKRILDYALGSDESTILAQPGPQYGNGAPPSTRICVADGDRVLFAGQSAYQVGRVATTANSGLITRLLAYENNTSHAVDYYASDPGANYTFREDLTSVFGPWLEGRQIRIEDDGELYLILKALDADADGVYESLYIARGESFAGYAETRAKARFLIQEHSQGFWYSKKDVSGLDPESVGQTNWINVRFPEDTIQHIGHVGDFLLVLGRKSLAYFSRIDAAMDGSTLAYSQPRYVYNAMGILAPRSFVNLPDGTALWLAPDAKLVMSTSEGAQAHPLSDFFQGTLRDIYGVDTEQLQYSHGFYDAYHDWYVLCLPDTGSGDFDHLLILDLTHKCLLLGTDYPLTCTLSNKLPGSYPSIYQGATQPRVYAGDTLGYISEVFADDTVARGIAGACRFTVQSGSTADRVEINTSAPAPFPSTNALYDLPAILEFADGTTEAFTCGANGLDYVEPAASLSRIPAVGDRLYIGLAQCGIAFTEIHQRHPAAPAELEIRLRNGQSQDQEIYFSIYTESGRDIMADMATARRTVKILQSQIEARRGIIPLPRVAGHALAYRLYFYPVGGGALSIGPLAISEAVHPAEEETEA